MNATYVDVQPILYVHWPITSIQVKSDPSFFVPRESEDTLGIVSKTVLPKLVPSWKSAAIPIPSDDLDIDIDL